MVRLADVRRWDPAKLSSVFARIGTARDRLLDLDTDLGAAAPPPDWAGPASQGARADHAGLAERLRRVAAGASALRPVLADTVDAVAGMQRDLAHADSIAASTGFAIDDDSAYINDARQVMLAPDQVASYQEQRTQQMNVLRSLVDGVLMRADQVDTTLADVLMRAAGGQVDDGATTTTLTAGAAAPLGAAVAPPPPGNDPAAAHTWWAGLSAAQREDVLVTHPEWVGNRDGIPAVVRDEANRAQLPDQTTALDAQLAAADARLKALRAASAPHPGDRPTQIYTPEEAALKKQIDDLQSRRDAAAAVMRAIDKPDRQLLLLDLGKPGGPDAPHAAVAVGDVDTADHVAVFTPGLTTTVANSIEGYTTDVQGVRDVATNELRKAGASGQTVATVAWIGYNAPQVDATILDPQRSVAFSNTAQKGGADLADFYDGIAASRPDDHPHLTALGHSYGSTTTGYALQHTRTTVDDAVVFGSPGLGTDSVSNLHVAPGHVAVLRADSDPVAGLGRFGPGPDHLPGVVNLSTGETNLPGHPAGTASVFHSQYFTPGSTSQYNIATTVAGLDDSRIAATRPDPPRPSLRNPYP